MVWNPLQKLKDKLSGKSQSARSSSAPVAPELTEAAAGGGVPDMKELEKKGLLRQFFRHWKDPAFLRQMQAVAARMKAEGVDVKDQAAVKAWIEKNQKSILSGELAKPVEAPKPQTVVKSGPDIGRNDPCSCGSGKKYKKCCGVAK
ncbi:MAG: SEC-C metal-binding domain-containing protein [Elusimicrobiota bacterium]|jgi:preprotein translocase subunit SecA